MDKKIKKYLLFGVPIAVGLYFVIRQFMGKKTYNDAINNPLPSPDPNNGGGNGNTGGGGNGGGNGGGGTGGGGTVTTGLVMYEVTTLVSNLNVRQQPSVTSSIVASLPKGTYIFAKPSTTNGWFEYYSNNVLVGYVSADYLTRRSGVSF
jgi:uncharacterized protein YgiM (DUF1202 family)